jgi:hypothetical protein
MHPHQSKLMVCVGPNSSQLQLINPNDEQNPFRVKTAEFDGFVLVRIKEFDGIIPDGCERHSGQEYFKGKRHMFSLHVQGTFSQEHTADDVVWAAEFERPINIPNFFVSFWKAIAPHSMADLGAQKPYIKSFAVTASSLIQTWSKKLDNFVATIQEDVSAILPSHLHIKKHKSFWYSEETNLVADRRKLFLIEENRKNLKFDNNTTLGNGD